MGTAIPDLRRWGVSADGDLVFRALVLETRLSTADLARSLGIGRRRAEAAVEELAAAAVASPRPHPGGGVSWVAREPDDAVTALRRRRFSRTDPWEQARRFLATVAALELPVGTDTGTPRVRRLTGPAIRDRIRDLVGAERYEHLSMQPEETFTSDAVAAALPLDKELLDRGVRMRMLGRPPADGDLSSGAAEELAGLGGDYRESEDIPVKLMVFDRRVVLLPAGPDAAHGALEVADPRVVAEVVALFGRTWERASDPGRSGIPAIRLTQRERAVVDALAEGLTDAEVARRIQLSPRTVGYALRGLMDRLAVENRFQLGLVLGAANAAAIPDEPLPDQQSA